VRAPKVGAERHLASKAPVFTTSCIIADLLQPLDNSCHQSFKIPHKRIKSNGCFSYGAMKVENLSLSITNIYLGVLFSGAKKIFFAEKERQCKCCPKRPR
jgi:hypothetical protein